LGEIQGCIGEKEKDVNDGADGFGVLSFVVSQDE
jgi:hypothetical protein